MLLLDDFISLIYPRICMACGNSLYKHEKIICNYCLYHLPKTYFHLEKDNPVSQKFWGRVNIESVAAYYYFSKAGKVQHLIHQLKYNKQKEIGIFVGKLYGIELKNSVLFKNTDIIVPVPLHPKKQRIRGYNQSEMFAKGLSVSMDVDINTNILYRNISSETQTKKSRYKRWENVKEIFKIKDAETLKDKNILLVDDVITTGSTLEACANALLQIPGTKVSIATMACTND